MSAMGDKLVKAFDMAKSEGGIQAELRLAMKSGMSRKKAEAETDAPELVSKLEAALEELLGKPLKL